MRLISYIGEEGTEVLYPVSELRSVVFNPHKLTARVTLGLKRCPVKFATIEDFQKFANAFVNFLKRDHRLENFLSFSFMIGKAPVPEVAPVDPIADEQDALNADTVIESPHG
jgi:hypothetical protein